MPLSKVKNRDRMREIRLHAKKKGAVVQPTAFMEAEDRADTGAYLDRMLYVDADGNPVYEE